MKKNKNEKKTILSYFLDRKEEKLMYSFLNYETNKEKRMFLFLNYRTNREKWMFSFLNYGTKEENWMYSFFNYGMNKKTYIIIPELSNERIKMNTFVPQLSRIWHC
jgi:hypothetical protein